MTISYVLTSLCQPIGLSILVAGVWIYNDVIIMPLIRRCFMQQKSSVKDQEAEN